MTSGYRELESITADLGLEAWGPDIAEALGQMTLGLASFLSDTRRVADARSHSVSINAHDTPSLIVQYFNEIIYLTDTERFLPLRADGIRLTDTTLAATVHGENFDPERHSRIRAVKAATYHGLIVDESPGKTLLRVIFDI